MQIKVKKKDGNPDADMDMILNKVKEELLGDDIRVSMEDDDDNVFFNIKVT